MTPVVHALIEVSDALDPRPVVVGGLAVLSRLQRPYRATVDLDVVDRGSGKTPYLEVLRATDGAKDAAPSGVFVQTPAGEVKVDVLAVNQADLDRPSDDAGDRLFASSHAWASDSASEMTLQVMTFSDEVLVVTDALIAEPGPLVAMKLQAITDRGREKQGTDLLDIVRLTLDAGTGPSVRRQIGEGPADMRRDIGQHVTTWFRDQRVWSLDKVHASAGADVGLEELDLVHDVLMESARGRT